MPIAQAAEAVETQALMNASSFHVSGRWGRRVGAHLGLE
jgi:hypothetical protein